MAAIKYIKRTVALDGNSISETLPASFFNGENTAHTFIIAGKRDGAAVAFTGSVSATFLNANDATVPLTGSIVDGAAVVTLSNNCYALSGRFTLTIDVNGATVYECQSRIKRRSSATAYDPTGEILPSIASLIERINTAVASVPADYSDLWASLAPVYDASASYIPGQFCTYNGHLYRCVAATSGDWAAASWAAVNIGGEIEKTVMKYNAGALRGGTCDLNDYKNVGFYFASSWGGGTVANAPTSSPYGLFYFIDVNADTYNNGTFVVQNVHVYNTNRNYVNSYRRGYSGGIWNPWVDIQAATQAATQTQIDSSINTASASFMSFTNGGLGGGSTDFNALTTAGYYFASTWRNATVQNAPISDSNLFFIISVSGDHKTLSTVLKQTVSVLRTDNTQRSVYWRLKNGSGWSDWHDESIPAGNSSYVIAKNGGGHSTSLIAGIEYCVQRSIRNVLVLPGTYDIIAELQEKYGANWETSIQNLSGVLIGNGIHVVFSNGAKVKMLYTGTNSGVRSMWSVFCTDHSDFTLENLNIECQNIRYCIHDECSGASEAKYIHKFINCSMSMVDTEDNTDWDSCYCIGGGLGKNGVIVIDGGHYYCNNSRPSWDGRQATAYYHNNANTAVGGESDVFIRNVYCSGRYGFMICGGQVPDNGKPARMYINGCRFTREVHSMDTGAFILKSWNNVVETDT